MTTDAAIDQDIGSIAPGSRVTGIQDQSTGQRPTFTNVANQSNPPIDLQHYDSLNAIGRRLERLESTSEMRLNYLERGFMSVETRIGYLERDVTELKQVALATFQAREADRQAREANRQTPINWNIIWNIIFFALILVVLLLVVFYISLRGG